MPNRTATIRDLRNRFSRVRRLIEQEGEVLVTERGTPRYRLVRYRPPPTKTPVAQKDYMERLRRHQPRALSAAEARALHQTNRGSR